MRSKMPDSDVGRTDESVCACARREGGRGVAPCMYHAAVIAEHQGMWHALDAIANGAPLDGDVGDFARSIRDGVRYRHGL